MNYPPRLNLAHLPTPIHKLERLSAGPKREILSPELEETMRQVLTWSAVDNQKLIVYFYLGSLHGEESANAVGKMLLLDFQAYVAKRYLNRGVTSSDLLQEGFCGLLEAIDRFDPARLFDVDLARFFDVDAADRFNAQHRA
jgi:hypothetical protein